MTLETRKPTGQPAWPLILVEGEEKGGKTTQALMLSASPKVGRTFVWDLGDGCADEYAALGPYEIVEFGGTYQGLIRSLLEAVALPPHEGRPNVFIIDSGTDLWDSEKVRADARARNSKRARGILKDDPDAEIETGMTYWNDAKARWARVIQILRTADGISIITAQGREVAKVQNGAPVANQTEWSIQAEKTLTSAVKAWVRVKRQPRSIQLMGLHRYGLAEDPTSIKLPIANALEYLVFEVIGIEGVDFAPNSGQQIVSDVAAEAGVPMVPVQTAKVKLANAFVGQGATKKQAGELASEAWHSAGLSDLTNEEAVSAEILADLLAQVKVPEAPPAQPPAETTAEPTAEPPVETGPDPERVTPDEVAVEAFREMCADAGVEMPQPTEDGSYSAAEWAAACDNIDAAAVEEPPATEPTESLAIEKDQLLKMGHDKLIEACTNLGMQLAGSETDAELAEMFIHARPAQ